MKTIPQIIVVLACCLALRVSGTEAIPFYGYTVSTGGYSGNIVGYANGGAGFAFSPSTDIVVTSLGFNGTDLVNGGYQVSLWNTGGSQLATTLITTSDPLFNQTRYDAISALTLSAGNTYYLRAVGASSGLWVGDVILASGPDANGTFSVSPDISYLGFAVGTNSVGVFPAEVHSDPLAYFIGANFQYVVPEPSAFCLGGLGLGLLALIRRVGKRR